MEDDPRAIDLAKELVEQYRVPRHDIALQTLADYIGEHGLGTVPVMWHHLARVIADVYTTAGLVVMPPEPETADIDKYTIYNNHARRLVILCQENPADAGAAVENYAREVGQDDVELCTWITLCLADLVSDGTAPD